LLNTPDGRVVTTKHNIMNAQILYTIIFLSLFVPFAIWMIWYLTSCPHQWKVVEKYEQIRNKDNKPIAYVHVKECQVCHKLKKDTIPLI